MPAVQLRGKAMNAFPRRPLSLSLLWLLASSGSVTSSTLAASSDTRDPAKRVSSEVEWHIQDNQKDALLAAAQVTQASDSDHTRSPLLIGVAIYIGISLLTDLAQSVVDVYFRYKSGGVIIDVRNTPIVVQTSKSVAPGYALVVSSDGAKTVQLGGAQKPDASMLKALLATVVK